MIFVSFSIEKIKSLSLTMPPLSYPVSCMSTTSNLYLAYSLATAVSDADLYRFLTFNIPNIIFLFHCLGLTKGSLQAWGTCIHFVTGQFLHWGVVSASLNPQAGGPALIGCPWLLIQYTLSHLLNRRSFLHSQPEDALCFGDRDPLYHGHSI